MTTSAKRKMVLILALFFALATGFIVLVTVSSPKFSYQLKTSDIQEAPQEPLKIISIDKGFTFETKFYDLRGNFASARLRRTLVFQREFPFLGADRNLVIVLTDQEIYDEEVFLYYEISGEINNLKPGEYKITMVDEFGNLIDETHTVVK